MVKIFKKRKDFTKLKNYRHVIIKLKNTSGHFVAWHMHASEKFYIPDNSPSEEPFSNVEYYLELNIRNKEI